MNDSGSWAVPSLGLVVAEPHLQGTPGCPTQDAVQGPGVRWWSQVLARVAAELSIHPIICTRLGKGGDASGGARTKVSILADTMEACHRGH
jgi:dsRNA-specific ribonuclease